MRRILVAVLGLGAAGCAAARAGLPVPALPFQADSARATVVAPGVAHWFVYAASGPWAINALVVDRDRCWSARAVKGFSTEVGREKTSALLERLDDTVEVIGGVNADFFRFDPVGVPTNLHVSRGRILTRPNDRPVLAFDSTGRPRIEHFGLLHENLGEGRGRSTLHPFHPMEAVGGRPILLRANAILPGVDSGGTFATSRHPRTAAGIARAGKRLMLVTVDGRQRPYSDGMTLRELAILMRALGADDAINLDGGGSTTMVIANASGVPRVINVPSDSAGERPVGNALAVVKGC
jgi:hypothetical protein